MLLVYLFSCVFVVCVCFVVVGRVLFRYVLRVVVFVLSFVVVFVIRVVCLSCCLSFGSCFVVGFPFYCL